MSSFALFQMLRDNFQNFAVLKVSTKHPELAELYKGHIQKHNASILTEQFPNSGFDLFVPEKTDFEMSLKSKMVSMDVKCEMLDKDGVSCGYYMYPRSSMSKTPLLLANHTGIIDSGYRGNLIGAFRNLGEPYTVEKESRLLQICHPLLCPIYVTMVEEEELSTTSRGEGGFGSTGV